MLSPVPDLARLALDPVPLDGAAAHVQLLVSHPLPRTAAARIMGGPRLPVPSHARLEVSSTPFPIPDALQASPGHIIPEGRRKGSISRTQVIRNYSLRKTVDHFHFQSFTKSRSTAQLSQPVLVAFLITP